MCARPVGAMAFKPAHSNTPEHTACNHNMDPVSSIVGDLATHPMEISKWLSLTHTIEKIELSNI